MLKSKYLIAENYVLSVILCLSLLFSLTTAFKITVSVPVIITVTIIFTTVFALISIFIRQRSSFLISLAVILIISFIILILSWDSIILQLNTAVNNVLDVYSKYLEVPEYVFFAATPFSYINDDVTALFVFISAYLSLIVTVSILRLKRIILCVFISLLFLVPCFVMTNTLPALLPLFGAVGTLLTLYATAFLRRKNIKKCCAAATAVTALVLAVVLIAVNAVFPLESFKRFEWQENLLKYAESFTDIGNGKYDEKGIEGRLNMMSDEVDTVKDLSDLGEFKLTGTKVMEVKTDKSGKLLLKGMAYADYENNEWSALKDSQTELYPNGFEAATLTTSLSEISKNKLVITPKGSQQLAYLPYFTTALEDFQKEIGDVCVVNDSKAKSYTVMYNDYNTTNDAFMFETDKNHSYSIFVNEIYTQLPDETRRELFKIADENSIIDADDNYIYAFGSRNSSRNKQLAQKVESFIKGCAKYSLTPDKMPENDDFAVWFVKDAEYGYCVHFATAATAMLRALGVPARFVTGYSINAERSTTNVVTSNNAHAWVEYFDEKVGWVPIDPTPPSYISEADSTQATASTPQSPTQSKTVPETKPKNQQKADTKSHELSAFGVIVAILLLIIAATTANALRVAIIRQRRKKRFTTGKTNTQAVFIYRYITELVRYTRNLIPDNIFETAQKAKFSNHIITESEVDMMRKYAQEERKELLKYCSKPRRLFYLFIKAF